jgi:hypothetical protein
VDLVQAFTIGLDNIGGGRNWPGRRQWDSPSRCGETAARTSGELNETVRLARSWRSPLRDGQSHPDWFEGGRRADDA